MGQHFDTLVEVVKKCIGEKEAAPGMPNVKAYFSSLISRSALFEFPLDPKEIFPNSGKDHEEYSKYIMDYFHMSEEYGQFMITPFKLTAIEDPISAVFLDPKGPGNYRVTLSKRDSEMERIFQNDFCASVVCGDVEVDISSKMGHSILFNITPLFYVAVVGNERNRDGILALADPLILECTLMDIKTATMSFIEENVYIMDPSNFIVEKRHRQYEIEKERQERKNGKKCRKEFLQKTIVRPHYTCICEEEMDDFFKVRSPNPKPVKAVRAHWRTLISERFVNKRWQVIPIPQYCRGEGEISGQEGWKYQIWLKESPTKIRPYKKE
ncbi:hypothetical protein KY308_04315 [Candidatus Woesearchaeota archaeon]|nr:hypothetical protein [Candidatus Woesearchaeota archaeon]